jgi:uncharacterized phage infection (PIP) family protein YhgE
MGVMAPLLGVVLTVVGFYWLKVGDEQQSLESILLAVTPLVSGVGTGAALALINQALLHIAGHRAESLRMSARTWFDTVIWSRGLDTQAATVQAVQAMGQFAGSMGDTAERYARNSNQIDESTTAMKDAASQFREVVHSFGAEIEGIPAALFEVRRATSASADALEELIRIGSRAVANLDVSVAAFRTTLDREFAAAAKLQHQSSQVLAESAQRIGEATGGLKSGSDDLKKTALANTASFELMGESIRKHVMPGNRQFYDAVQGLAGQMAAVSQDVSKLSANIEAVAGQFDKVTGSLVPSVALFCDAIEHRFGPAVSQQSTQVEIAGRSMQRLREMAEGMAKGATTLNSMLHDVSPFVSQTRATHVSLAEAVTDLRDLAGQLRQSVESDLAPSQRALHEVATSLAQTAAQLAEFMAQGIGPATHQLATLHEKLAGLKATADAIKDFSNARADIDHLNDRLARAAEISDAISALPDQIRNILEQKLDHGAAEAGSSGRFMTWLAGRPR